MGFHICEYCQKPGSQGIGVVGADNMVYGPYSSADVTLVFENGHKWQFPHVGLLHYVTEHRYLPPVQFILDVMNGSMVGGEFAQTKSPPTPVGYLTGSDFPTGDVPKGFVERLERLIQQAQVEGTLGFRQTRSFKPKSN